MKPCAMARIRSQSYVEQARKYYEKSKDILSKTTESEAYRSLYLYLKYIAKLPETAEEYRVLWEKALAGEKERDVAMEREQVRRIDEKWGGML